MRRITLLIVLLGYMTAEAQDRLFTYTYQSTVLNKGQKEIEIWNTFHWERVDYYRAFKHRIEYEVGLGNRLQTAFYLNITNTANQITRSVTTNGVTHAEADLAMSTGFSFSNEWKYKLSDPVANAIGSGLYGEVTLAPHEIEFEAKILLDKQLGKTTHALNLVGELELESEAEEGKIEQEAEYAFEFDYGFSVKVAKGWNVGLELRNHNAVNEDDGWQYSALFGGPGFSYFSDKFWVNFTVMPQLGGLYHHREEGLTDGKVLDDHEKLETRLMFSFVL